MHYYDVLFQDQFCKNKEGDKREEERALRRRVSEKKLKRKESNNEDAIYNEEVIFSQYIYLLGVALSSKSMIDFLKDLKNISQGVFTK